MQFQASSGFLTMAMTTYCECVVVIIQQHISFTPSSYQDGCPELPDSPCGNVGPVTWPQTEIGQVASVQCRCGLDDELIRQLRGTRRCGGTYETGAVLGEPQCESCQFSETRRMLCATSISQPVGSSQGETGSSNRFVLTGKQSR